MRIPNRYKMRIHMQPVHAQCKDNYSMLSKQKDSMFPRCTLTEWGHRAKFTNCIISNYKRIWERRSAHKWTNEQASSFSANYFSNDYMCMGSIARCNRWLPQSTSCRTAWAAGLHHILTYKRHESGFSDNNRGPIWWYIVPKQVNVPESVNVPIRWNVPIR